MTLERVFVASLKSVFTVGFAMAWWVSKRLLNVDACRCGFVCLGFSMGILNTEKPILSYTGLPARFGVGGFRV